MIRLTRLNHVGIVLNSDLIEHIDVTPDTVITLTTGQILRVRESADDVVERIVDFRDKAFARPGGIDAQVVARRNLAKRLELGALALVHLRRSV